MRRERVLITGATGFLGRHLAEAFRSHGYEVVASARTRNDEIMIDEWLVGDITNPAVQEAAVKGCALVVNAAGRVNNSGSSEREREQMFRLNCMMTESLALAAARGGVKRFLHVSSTAVYGSRAPRLCDESTPCSPDDVYGKSKRAGEERLLAMGNDGMRIVIVRPSNVFGERHSWNKLLSWMKTVRRGKVFLARIPGQALVNYVYVVDVAEAIVSLANSQRIAGGEILNINTHATMADFFQATALAVGGDCHARVVPRVVFVAAATMFDIIKRLTGWHLPLTKEKAREMTGDRVFSSERLVDLCPEFPCVGLQGGLVRLAQYYRNAGLL